MAQYFLSTVRYNKTMDNGAIKTVSEQYLFDALSYTEAEARTIAGLTPYISGEFSITSLVKPRIAELFRDTTADRFYKVTVEFITIDEKTAVEKKTKSHILVQAPNFDAAVKNFKERMSGTLADYEIYAVTETAILEFYPAKLADNTSTE